MFIDILEVRTDATAKHLRIGFCKLMKIISYLAWESKG